MLKFNPAGILLGLVVGITLAVALESIAIGIGVGAGLGLIFSSSSKRYGNEEDNK